MGRRASIENCEQLASRANPPSPTQRVRPVSVFSPPCDRMTLNDLASALPMRPSCHDGAGAIALKRLVARARTKAKGVAATTKQSPLKQPSPDEIYRGEAGSAELPSPVALVALDSFVYRLLVRKGDAKSGIRAYFSLASRSPPALSHGPFSVETAHGRAASRAPTQSQTRPSLVEPSRLADDRVAPPTRTPIRYSPRLLLLACGFTAGVSAGVGGTYVLSANLPLGTHLQEMGTPPFADDIAGERRVSVRAQMVRSDAPSDSMRPSGDELPRDPNEASQAARETDSNELSAPVPVIVGKVEWPTNRSETAPTASVETPSPATGAGGTSPSADPIVDRPTDQGASSAAEGSRDGANATLIVTTPNQVAAVAPEEMRAIASVAMTRGNDAIGHGDIMSARRFYEFAASSGLTQAATAVGRTYDPNFLRDKGVRGRLADAEAAKRWYQKAVDGGDAEARMQLDILLHAEKAPLPLR
jgi:hypothetical protein